MRVKRTAAFLLLGLLLVLAGCGKNTKTDKKAQLQIWYLSDADDALEHAPYEGEAETEGAILDEFFTLLTTVPDKSNLHPLLDDNVQLRTESLKDGILTLDFSGSYRNMSSTREVLARAGIVRTFDQLDCVSFVRFTIEGEEAVSPAGLPLGLMSANSFVEDAGKQINSIQHVAINLYFTGDKGTTLRQEARSIYYTSSKPLEWAIVERIIAGPKVEGNYPTVPANTQIISVSRAGNTCYVNLNQTFLTNALSIDEKVPIYSIVNSLVDNCREIEEVQISVEGENSIIFKQSMDLSHPFAADFTLLEAMPS